MIEKNKKSKRVALCTMSGYDIISSPLVNLAKYLVQRGYEVDIFCVGSNKFPALHFDEAKICLIIANLPPSRIPFYKFFRIVAVFMKKAKKNSYSFLIGYDPKGLKVAALFSVFWRVPFVYHSLEISSMVLFLGWRQRAAKWLENILSKRALFCITQDETRAKCLSKENGVARDKILVLPNSPLGKSMPQKSRYFRDKFSIVDSKVMVLLVGSLIPEHMIEELVEAALYWPDQYVLVLHGWFADKKFEQRIRDSIVKNKDKIYLSTEVFPFKEKLLVFQSADIGLAFYRPINDNFIYVGAAAGKIFDFLRCGVPVIANDLPGMEELLTKPGCGEVVKSCEDIGAILSVISLKLNSYRKAALAVFDKYEFSRSAFPMINKIENVLGFADQTKILGKEK